MNITTATPAEVDGQIAKLNVELAQQRAVIDRAERTIEMERKYRAPDGSVNQHRIDQCRQIMTKARNARDELFTAAEPFVDEWKRRGGWTRYYLVDSNSSTGHVHYDASARH